MEIYFKIKQNFRETTALGNILYMTAIQNHCNYLLHSNIYRKIQPTIPSAAAYYKVYLQ